ncbi:hypothetical protein FACS189493_8460 [Spirochaetia bacterium]|nr:hypothetical protein FACS189493_8460 [Spirochaetia bacterium]
MKRKNLFKASTAVLLTVFMAAALLFTACGDQKPPDAPGKPTLVAEGGTLTVSWKSVSNATGYEVYLHTSDNSEAANEKADTAELTATISGLTNNTFYYVWVKAKNSYGSSGFSPVAIRTLAPVPAGLKETWINTDYEGEKYTITDTAFTSIFDDSVGYAGTIVNVRPDGLDAGYITIKYTENLYSPDAVGNYYVIRWEDLSELAIVISAAYNSDEPNGYATLADAETNYVGGIGDSEGSFTGSSNCTK